MTRSMLTLTVIGAEEPDISHLFSLWEQLRLAGTQVTLSSTPIDDDETTTVLDGATSIPPRDRGRL